MKDGLQKTVIYTILGIVIMTALMTLIWPQHDIKIFLSIKNFDDVIIAIKKLSSFAFYRKFIFLKYKSLLHILPERSFLIGFLYLKVRTKVHYWEYNQRCK